LRNQEHLTSADDYQYVYRDTKFEPVQLPKNCVLLEDLPEHHPVKQYAINRGIISWHQYLYFDEPGYRKRLVVPFMYNNELVGWTGRHIAPASKSVPKYLHNMQTGYVFNLDRFVNTEREILIVTEGVMDAIAVDGVAVLSNTVSTEQLQLIKKLNTHRVILCPDLEKSGRPLIEQALDLGWEVSFPPWSQCKDAADAARRYGRLLTVRSIIKHATDNKIKAQVKMRMI
jgi:hypothetical protein